jgi:hypothetical protein
MDIQIPLAISRLRSFCVKKFSLGIKVPKKYGLFNRKGVRSIANFSDLLHTFKRKLPKYKWRIRGFPSLINVSAEMFDSMRVFVAPQGAGTTNMLFMQRGTLVVDLEPNQCANFYLNMSRVLGLNMVYVWVRNMSQRYSRPTDLEPELVMTVVEAVGKQLRMMDSKV